MPATKHTPTLPADITVNGRCFGEDGDGFFVVPDGDNNLWALPLDYAHGDWLQHYVSIVDGNVATVRDVHTPKMFCDSLNHSTFLKAHDDPRSFVLVTTWQGEHPGREDYPRQEVKGCCGMILAPITMRPRHPMWLANGRSVLGCRIMVPVAMHSLYRIGDDEADEGINLDWEYAMWQARDMIEGKDFDNNFDPESWPGARRIEHISHMPTGVFIAGCNLNDNSHSWESGEDPGARNITLVEGDDPAGDDCWKAWNRFIATESPHCAQGPRLETAWLNEPRFNWAHLDADVVHCIAMAVTETMEMHGRVNFKLFMGLRGVNKVFRDEIDGEFAAVMRSLDFWLEDGMRTREVKSYENLRQVCHNNEVAPWDVMGAWRFKDKKHGALRFMRLKLAA